MVRDNWETRVENAVARRKESKQRKQRNEDKRQHKIWIQHFLDSLDRLGNNTNNNNKEEGLNNITLQIWTDSIASDSPPLLDLVEGGGGGGGIGLVGGDLPLLLSEKLLLSSNNNNNNFSNKRRVRAASMGTESDHNPAAAVSLLSSAAPSPLRKGGGTGGGAGGRARSNSTPYENTFSTNKKKAGGTVLAGGGGGSESGASWAPSLLLCKSHFFQGKCEDSSFSSSSSSRKKGCACRYVHYSSPYKTLATALLSNPNNHHHKSRGDAGASSSEGASASSSPMEQLKQAERAVESGDSSELGSMDMVYYVSVQLNGKNKKEGPQGQQQSKSTSDASPEEEQQPQIMREPHSPLPSTTSTSFTAATTTTTSTTPRATRTRANSTSPSWSEELVEELTSTHKIKVSSIVYIVINGSLVYDRFREGCLSWNNNNNNNSTNRQQQQQGDWLLMHLTGGDPSSWTLSTSTLLASPGPGKVRRRLLSVGGSTSTTSTTTATSEEDARWMREILTQKLPGHVLEHIITFLPDAAVAFASQVCLAWHHEIGRNSPHLWKHLLERQGWPMPLLVPPTLTLTHTPTVVPEITRTSMSSVTSSNNNNNSAITKEESKTTTMAFRDAYVQHYTAVRDVKAIRMALNAISYPGGGSNSNNNKSNKIGCGAVGGAGIGIAGIGGDEQKEMAYQDFSTRKHAPSEPSCCVSVQIWSPNRILAAYSRDCSLRLFETMPRIASVGEALLQQQQQVQLSCRELVCQRVDPYRNTKRRSCGMLSMGLDEDSIGCLCHVMADNVDAEAYVLVVLSRDDFLLGDSNNSSTGGITNHLKVIDIGEAVLNYCLSADEVDHRLLDLMDFLEDGGEIGGVEVLASRSLVACGFGRYMVEVSISIPADDMDGHDDDDSSMPPMHLLDRKLVLFSASVGAIVWMGESNDVSRPLRPRHEDMTLASLRRPGVSRAACSVLVASATSPAIMIATIDSKGHADSPHLIEASDSMSFNMLLDLGEEWTVASLRHRAVHLVTSDAIAVQVLHKTVNDRVVERKSIVSFYPRYPAVNEPSHDVVVLEGDIEVIRISSLRDKHVLCLCRQYTVPRATAPTMNVMNNNNNDNNQGGEAEIQAPAPPPPAPRVSVCAILVHVESRTEIKRIPLIDGVGLDLNEIPEISAVSDDTIGVGLSWKGILMTGSAIRAVGEPTLILRGGEYDTAAASKSAKKKKKKVVNVSKKSSKKDGFARGMSLRG